MLYSVTALLDEASLFAKGRGGAALGPLYEAFKLVHSGQVDILGTIGRAISEGESLREVSRRLSHRRVEEDAERMALLGACRSILDNNELSKLHPWGCALQSYFELLPLSGSGHAAEVMESAITHAAREPDSFRARGELANAADISLRAVQRAARLVANGYSALHYGGLERRAAG